MTTAVTFLDRKWPHLRRDDDVIVRAHVGRIDDLRDSMNRRFEDLRDLLKSEVKRLEERFDHVDERFDRVEQRLERLEHPIVRQS